MRLNSTVLVWWENVFIAYSFHCWHCKFWTMSTVCLSFLHLCMLKDINWRLTVRAPSQWRSLLTSPSKLALYAAAFSKQNVPEAALGWRLGPHQAARVRRGLKSIRVLFKLLSGHLRCKSEHILIHTTWLDKPRCRTMPCRFSTGNSNTSARFSATKRVKQAKADPGVTKQHQTSKRHLGAIHELKLTAIARRWGSSDWVFHSPGTLWQIQVCHYLPDDRAPGKALFKKNLIETVQMALRHHPQSPEIYDLKTLLRVAKVKVLNRAPLNEKMHLKPWSNDPDNMNLREWEPVLYAAGDTPYEALTVVRLVMEEKVRAKLLPRLPALHLVWALRAGEKPPEAGPPKNWMEVQEEVSGQRPDGNLFYASHCPFEVLPALGRRHILAHLQRPACPEGKYSLTFSGGIYYFRDKFDKAKVPGRRAAHPRMGDQDFVRVLYNQDGGNTSKTKVATILNDVLGGIPVLLTHETGEGDDAFLQWLLEQRSIVLDRSSSSSSFAVPALLDAGDVASTEGAWCDRPLGQGGKSCRCRARRKMHRRGLISQQLQFDSTTAHGVDGGKARLCTLSLMVAS